MFVNKIMGALLAVALAILALPTLSNIVFGKGGHHGGHHGEEKPINERVSETFAYYLPLTEGGAGPIEEEVFDLGAALASASVADGAASFKSKCSSCHTAGDGEGNKQGPNLHGVVGRHKAGKADFGGYSSALASMDSSWTYENLNGFLANPKGYVDGTAMNFIGLRRDSERANVIAYLASETPNAPAFPEPLPEETEAACEPAAEGEEGAEACVVEAAGEAEAENNEAGVLEVIEGAVEEGGAAVEEAAGEVEEAANDAAEEVTETVEEAHDGH